MSGQLSRPESEQFSRPASADPGRGHSLSLMLEKGLNGIGEVSESNPESPPSPAHTFPEGGWRGWLTVIGGSMIVFCSFGAVQSYGAFEDFYARHTLSDRTPSEISWIGSVQVFWLFAMGLLSGKLFDEGYFHHCIGFGSALYLFSVFMLSLAKPHQFYQHLLSQGFGMGIGMGLMFLPALSVPSHYFRARRSVAMGVVLAGSSLGAVIYPIMLNNLFKSAGFAWAVRATGFLDVALLLFANIVMRTRLPSRKQRPAAPPIEIKKILTDRAYMVFLIGASITLWGFYIPFFYLQLFSALHGVNKKMVTYSLSVMNAASIFGRTLPNVLADMWGPLNVVVPFTFIAGGLVWAMYGATDIAGVIVFGIFYGFFSGGFISLVNPVSATFAADVNEIGTRSGLLAFSFSFFALTGSPIGGALLNPPHYTWWQPLLFGSTTMIFGATCLFIARIMMVRRKGSNRV